MREYELTKQYMTEQMQYAEKTRQIGGISQPTLLKRLMTIWNRQSSTVETDTQTLTPSHQFERTATV